MARTPFNAAIDHDTSYTIPVGKYAVFAAHSVGSSSSTATLRVDGVAIGTALVNTSIERASIKPLTASAGQVISCAPNVGEAFGLSGFLYDA